MVVVLLGAPALHAQEPDPAVEEARAHFQQGVTAYEQGDYVTALREFRRAFELRPSDGLRYNLGAALYKTEQLVESRTELQLYLTRADPARITAERRDEVNGLLALIDAAVGLLELPGAVDGARVAVDGIEAGVAPLAGPLAMMPGEHELVITADGFEAFVTQVSVQAGERRTLDTPLVALVATPIEPPPGIPVVPEQPEPAPEGEAAGLSDAWFWAAVGTAGALAVGGAVTGGLVLAKQSDFDDAVARWHQGETDAYAEGQSLAQDGDALGTATTALFIAAGAAAATALVLAFFTDFGGEHPEEPAAMVGLGPLTTAETGPAPGLALSAMVRF
jgi:tetratricopeptide (TPR) repeat protein